MNRLKKIPALFVFCFVLFFCTSTDLHGQKYGHMNSGNLLELLPETKSANEQLRIFQDGLVKQGQSQAKEIEAEYAKFLDDNNKGLLTPVQVQKVQENLLAKQQGLQAFEQEVIDKVGRKREELFTPILKKVQNAIDAVGAEGGYMMIFDTSILTGNPIVYAADADDVMAKVKAKLGL